MTGIWHPPRSTNHSIDRASNQIALRTHEQIALHDARWRGPFGVPGGIVDRSLTEFTVHSFAGCVALHNRNANRFLRMNYEEGLPILNGFGGIMDIDDIPAWWERYPSGNKQYAVRLLHKPQLKPSTGSSVMIGPARGNNDKCSRVLGISRQKKTNRREVALMILVVRGGLVVRGHQTARLGEKVTLLEDQTPFVLSSGACDGCPDRAISVDSISLHLGYCARQPPWYKNSW